MFDLDSEDVPSGRNNIDWLEGVARANLKSDAIDFHPYRILPNGLFAVATHQVEWFSAKKGGKTSFPRLCPRFNPETLKLDRTWPQGHPKAGELVDCACCDDLGTAPRMRFYLHAIDRMIQQHAPHMNPVKVLDLPDSPVQLIKEKKPLNVHAGTAYPVSDAQYGIDILLKFDNSKSPAQKYSVERGNHTPLTAQELALPRWDLKELYTRKGFHQANPEELRKFLQRVKLIPGGNGGNGGGGTQMPSGGGEQLPETWGGPAFGGGGFQPQSQPAQQAYVPPQQPQQGFQPPQTQMPQQAAYTPPQAQPAPQQYVPPQVQPQAAQQYVPPTQTAPATRFSGPPTQQQPDAFASAIAGPGPVSPGPVNLTPTANLAGAPACGKFKDENTRGMPVCMSCPVKTPCWAED